MENVFSKVCRLGNSACQSSTASFTALLSFICFFFFTGSIQVLHRRLILNYLLLQAPLLSYLFPALINSRFPCLAEVSGLIHRLSITAFHQLGPLYSELVSPTWILIHNSSQYLQIHYLHFIIVHKWCTILNYTYMFIQFRIYF